MLFMMILFSHFIIFNKVGVDAYELVLIIFLLLKCDFFKVIGFAGDGVKIFQSSLLSTGF